MLKKYSVTLRHGDVVEHVVQEARSAMEAIDQAAIAKGVKSYEGSAAPVISEEKRRELVERRKTEYPKVECPDFAPRDGFCHSRNIHQKGEPTCGADLVEEYGDAYPTAIITGCSACGSSYCD